MPAVSGAIVPANTLGFNSTAPILSITATPNPLNRINLTKDASGAIDVFDNGTQVGSFDPTQFTSILIDLTGITGGLNFVTVSNDITIPTTIRGGAGTNYLQGGGGQTVLTAGPRTNRLTAGSGNTLLLGTQGDNTLAGGAGINQLVGGGTGRNFYFGFTNHDTIVSSNPTDFDFRGQNFPANLSQTLGLVPSPQVTINTSEVNALLSRAAAATSSDDGIVAVVDRSGRILGVRVEGNVSPAITGNTEKLVFAIDGAVAEARTGAFFGNNQAPLTSRTIQDISQTTITQREAESDPNITDPNSTLRGPGLVAPVGIQGHFPPGVAYTPQVDLFDIEASNRDTTIVPDANGVIQPNGPVRAERFNVNPADIPSAIPVNEQLAPPDSYGFASGLLPTAQPRGIGTLPGGIPIYKNGVVVGGIGVFFPGTTGFATAENSKLSSTFDPSKPDRSLEAEYDAFAALGGIAAFPFSGPIGGVPLPAGFGLPSGRIDLVGITLDIFGPNGNQGPAQLVQAGQKLNPGQGDPNSGFLAPLLNPGPTNKLNPAADTLAPGNLLNGTLVPEGWLVTPHAGPSGLTADDVTKIIEQGVVQAQITRAAIRLPLDSLTSMVFAVADPLTGEVLGLFRMPDSTVFSLDIAVAKARNVSYYADTNLLQPIDEVPGVPPGTAISSRTIRYLALPRYPEGIEGSPPGPFSILNDGGVDLNTALNVGPPLPASAYQSVQGHDIFNPQSNFRDPTSRANQNGIVFFPGGVPLYKNNVLVGGVGISGDGVDQDDVVTFASATNFTPPPTVQTADEVFVRGVRLPYQKFNRQPLAY
jgi:uncharacterized protein GlcG (DUF336 family)